MILITPTRGPVSTIAWHRWNLRHSGLASFLMVVLGQLILKGRLGQDCLDCHLSSYGGYCAAEICEGNVN
eukprot:s3488_g9.t1